MNRIVAILSFSLFLLNPVRGQEVESPGGEIKGAETESPAPVDGDSSTPEPGSVSAESPRGTAAARETGSSAGTASSGAEAEGANSPNLASENVPDPPTDALRRPTPEVMQAIRLVLSSNPRDQNRGASKLHLLGPAVLPQLRYWLRSAQTRTARVESIIATVDGGAGVTGRIDGAVALFLAAKREEAERLAQSGRLREAQDIAEALLTLDPNHPHAWEIRRLRRRCRDRLAARELLEPSFEVSGAVFDLGSIPDLTFRLRNHMNQRAYVHLEQGVLGYAEVEVTRVLASGDRSTVKRRLRVEVDAREKQIVLDPGTSWTHEVDFELEEDLPLVGAVARIVVAGRFRPTRWTGNDPNANLTLSLPALEFWVVPPGQISLSDRPLEKMTAALLFGKAEAFFVGGQLAVWAGEEDAVYNGRLVETLIENLDDLDPTRLGIAGRLLAQATGVDCGANATKWREWWQQYRGDEAASGVGN